MLRQKYQFKNYNWMLVIAVMVLCGLGVLFINSADSTYTSRQFLGLLVCTAVMFFLSVVNYNFIGDYSRILYVLNLILLLLVKVPGLGVNVGGATRWLNLGFTRIQPSEFTKIIMIIFVAVYIQEHEEDLNEWKNLIKLAALCAVPLLLVVIEPDLSTTIAITVILLAVIFVGGLDGKLIRRCFIIGVPLLVLFLWYIQTPNQILLREYQVTRIMTFLNPSKYEDTTAYQQQNSEMAIGSGQLYGKGINNNTISEVTVTDTGLVSEQQTDFIFSVAGEELGYLGCIAIIALLLAIIIRCMVVARRAKTPMGMLICVGFAGMLAFQTLENIGMCLFVMPVIGLTLPFFSYGGSSLITVFAAMGIVSGVKMRSLPEWLRD